MDDDPSRNMLVPRLHPHAQSIMTRSPNEGLYSNLYDKDMSLMRKLMNLDEFQCSSNGNGSNITAPNSDINASKQFHPYTNNNSSSSSNGIFNGKFTNAANFPSTFPYDKQQHQPPNAPPPNGMRNHLHHDGLLKPCYEHFATPTKSEPTTTTTTALDDNFGNTPIVGGYNSNNNNNSKKQSSSTTTSSTAAAAAALFSSGNGSSSSGGSGVFMNQFPHESLFGANNHPLHHHHHPHHNHANFTSKLNEINNNSNNNNNNNNINVASSGGIVIKLENGGNMHANDFTKMSNEHQQQNLCSRSSTTIATASNKTEPNEFRNNGNNNSSSSGNINKDNNNHIDNDDERKNSTLHHDDSNDGFTQL